MNPQLNGHQEHIDEDGEIDATPASKDVYAMRVHRVFPGDNFYLRTLSDSYGGCFTHYVRAQKRSLYCPGETCKEPLHNNPHGFTWKGYCCVEVYDKNKKLWFPTVFEITERLEQDFRHRFKRGQVWNVFRYVEKNSGEPVMGTLEEEHDPKTWPKPFDMQPVLRTMYHWNGVILLTTKNPLPDRVLAVPTVAPGPRALEPTAESVDEGKRIGSFVEEFERRKKAYSDKKRK